LYVNIATDRNNELRPTKELKVR